MRKLSILLRCLFIAIFLNNFLGYTQYEEFKKQPLRMGVSYGLGSQQAYPFNSRNYNYSYSSYRILLHYQISEHKAWKFTITLEPGINGAQHQLLNPYYVQPKHGSNYLELRESLTIDKSITEYVLDLGFLVRHQTFRNLSFFVQGGVGPMISNRFTERMAKGFAFSDVFAFGCSTKIGGLQLAVRTGIRHVSNFNTKLPNSGYNAVIFDFGLTHKL